MRSCSSRSAASCSVSPAPSWVHPLTLGLLLPLMAAGGSPVSGGFIGYMLARQLGEARVEAEALLDGLLAAMTADGDLLSADETAALQSDMKNLETVMAANQPDDIREATEILGKASEVFAARRMDRSIQKALQGVSLSQLESDVAEESTP